MKKIAFFLMAVAVFMTTACKDKDIAVTGVSLNESTLDLTVGSKETLVATVAPTDATNQEVVWISSAATIASVSQTGEVNAVAPGQATITVTTRDGGKSANCTVNVTEPTFPVTGVTVTPTSLELVEGETEELTPNVAPSNATNKNVTWLSDDTDVATVSTAGLVTAVGVGTAIITVTTQESSFKATCTVTVSGISVTGVKLPDAQSFPLEATIYISPTIEPNDATNKKVTWSSSSNGVVSVDEDGKLTAVSKGTATITVTTDDGGFKATCTVTVLDAAIELLSGTIWQWDDRAPNDGKSDCYGKGDAKNEEYPSWWTPASGHNAIKNEWKGATMTFNKTGLTLVKDLINCTQDEGTFNIAIESNPKWRKSIGKLTINGTTVLNGVGMDGIGDIHEYNILKLTENELFLAYLAEDEDWNVDEIGWGTAFLWRFIGGGTPPTDCGEVKDPEDINGFECDPNPSATDIALLCGTDSKIWTWDAENENDVVWGNGPFLLDIPSNWWNVPLKDVNGQSPDEGEGAFMTFSKTGLTMVKTKSDGEEVGGVFCINMSETKNRTNGDPWSIGKLYTEVPVLNGKSTGDEGGYPVFYYDILKLTDTEMVLANPREPWEWGACFFWLFKAVEE